jgi:putative ABC transport system permease protein
MITRFFQIALRNILRHRRRSAFSFSALFLALAVLVSVRGFLNGLQQSIRESAILGLTGAIQIHRSGYLQAVLTAPLDLHLPADDAFLGRVRAVKGVRAAAARLTFNGLLNANDLNSVSIVAAIDPKEELAVCPRRLEMVSSGRMLAQSGPAAGILTPELAARLGLELGQRAALLTTDRDGVMRALELDFVGVYGQPGLLTPDKKLAFVPLRFAQELLGMPDLGTEIVVAVEKIDQIEETRQRLQAMLGPDYEVSTWRDVASYVEDLTTIQNFVLQFIGALFLFVALTGIANVMLMSILERTREIGTMMACGLRRRQVLGLFLLEAALLGLCGGALGCALGTGLVLHYAERGILFRIPGIPAPFHVHPAVSADYILQVLVVAACGAVLAALGPSLRALRMRPVEALADV